MGEASIVSRVDEKAERGVVPSWAQIITMGVDVQADRFVWVVSGWRSNTRGCVIDHGEAGGWEELQDVIARVWPQDGTARNFQPCYVLIDSGDGLMTGDVYQFCSQMDRARGQVLPVKGSSAGLNTFHRMSIRDAVKDRKGHIRAKESLVLIDTAKVKDFLASCLDRPVGSDAAFTFHDEVASDLTFQRQIVSEERGRDPKAKSNRTLWKTRDGYEANHFWDALVYATTGALMRGVLRGGTGNRIRRDKSAGGMGPGGEQGQVQPIEAPRGQPRAVAAGRPRPRGADPWGRRW
jgi:phage terminase large subunit GpA-like protein